MSSFSAHFIAFTALLVGWTHGSVLLIFAGTYILVQENIDKWGDE